MSLTLSLFRRLGVRVATMAALLTASSMVGPAATVDWTGTTSTAWATGANWSGSVAPVNDITTDIARFNLPAYGATSPFNPNAGTRSIAGLSIGSSSGALTLSTTNLSIGAGGITVDSGAAAATIGLVTIAADQIWNNNSANTLTISSANFAPTYAANLTLASGAITFTSNSGAPPTTGPGVVTIDGAAVVLGNVLLFGSNAVTLKSGSLNIGNKTYANNLVITGDFSFGNTSGGSNYSGLKTTTGNVALTFTGSAGISFITNALSLGGDLEIKSTSTNNANLTSGLALNGTNRTLTLSQTAGNTTIGKITLDADLTITGTGTQATALNGAVDTGGVARTITFNNSGTGVPTLSGDLSVGAASTITIAGSSTNARIGALTGATAHAIEVNSTTGGNITFNGASTYTGGTTITSGIATASLAGVAGVSGPLGTGATIINGGRLDSSLASALLGSSSVTVNGGELRGTVGNAWVTSAGGLTLNGGVLRGFNALPVTYGGGAINVTGNSTIVNERSGAASATSLALTFGSSVTVGGSQLNVTSTDNQTGGIATVTLGAGTLTGNGILSVTKNPSATDTTVLSLSTLGVTGGGNAIAVGNGSVTASGLTTIGGGSAGFLAVNGLLTATGGVALSSNGTLGGAGTIAGTVTTASSTSILAPGNSPGTLSITGALNAANGADFKFELGPTSGGGVSDILAISGLFTGSTAAGGLIFDFTNFGAGASTGTPYTLLTFGSNSGLNATDLFTNSPGFVLDSSFGTGGFLINGTSLQVQFTAVPEPGTWALLIAGSATLIAFRRRTRIA